MSQTKQYTSSDRVLRVGDTVELSKGQIATVQFIGKTNFATGVWYGIEYIDGTLGKNDGAIGEKRYFKGANNRCAFIKRQTIRRKVGQKVASDFRNKSSKPATPSAKRHHRMTSLSDVFDYRPSTIPHKPKPTPPQTKRPSPIKNRRGRSVSAGSGHDIPGWDTFKKDMSSMSVASHLHKTNTGRRSSQLSTSHSVPASHRNGSTKSRPSRPVTKQSPWCSASNAFENAEKSSYAFRSKKVAYAKEEAQSISVTKHINSHKSRLQRRDSRNKRALFHQEKITTTQQLKKERKELKKAAEAVATPPMGAVTPNMIPKRPKLFHERSLSLPGGKTGMPGIGMDNFLSQMQQLHAAAIREEMISDDDVDSDQLVNLDDLKVAALTAPPPLMYLDRASSGGSSISSLDSDDDNAAYSTGFDFTPQLSFGSTPPPLSPAKTMHLSPMQMGLSLVDTASAPDDYYLPLSPAIPPIKPHHSPLSKSSGEPTAVANANNIRRDRGGNGGGAELRSTPPPASAKAASICQQRSPSPAYLFSDGYHRFSVADSDGDTTHRSLRSDSATTTSTAYTMGSQLSNLSASTLPSISSVSHHTRPSPKRTVFESKARKTPPPNDSENEMEFKFDDGDEKESNIRIVTTPAQSQSQSRPTPRSTDENKLSTPQSTKFPFNKTEKREKKDTFSLSGGMCHSPRRRRHIARNVPSSRSPREFVGTILGGLFDGDVDYVKEYEKQEKERKKRQATAARKKKLRMNKIKALPPIKAVGNAGIRVSAVSPLPKPVTPIHIGSGGVVSAKSLPSPLPAPNKNGSPKSSKRRSSKSIDQSKSDFPKLTAKQRARLEHNRRKGGEPNSSVSTRGNGGRRRSNSHRRVGSSPTSCFRGELMVGNQYMLSGHRIGICRFIGKTEFATGLWIGFEVISGVGRHSGEVAGQTYFNCSQPGQGLFVQRNEIQEDLGDFKL